MWGGQRGNKRVIQLVTTSGKSLAWNIRPVGTKRVKKTYLLAVLFHRGRLRVMEECLAKKTRQEEL